MPRIRLGNLVIFSLSLVFGGCATATTLKTPPGSDSFARALKPQATVGALTLVKVEVNGVEGSPTSSFDELIKNKLKETNLFDRIREDMFPGKGNVAISVFLRERYDAHEGVNNLKGLLRLCSLLLLSPVLRFHYDVDSTLELKAVRWDHQERTYHAQGSGTASCFKFLECASPTIAAASNPLPRVVVTNLLNDVMGRMVVDAPFYGGQ